MFDGLPRPRTLLYPGRTLLDKAIEYFKGTGIKCVWSSGVVSITSTVDFPIVDTATSYGLSDIESCELEPDHGDRNIGEESYWYNPPRFIVMFKKATGIPMVSKNFEGDLASLLVTYFRGGVRPSDQETSVGEVQLRDDTFVRECIPFIERQIASIFGNDIIRSVVVKDGRWNNEVVKVIKEIADTFKMH